MVLSLVLFSTVLTGCGKEDKEGILESKKDKATNMIIVTEDKSIDPKSFNAAKIEVLNNKHRTKRDSAIRVKLRHKVLPKLFIKPSMDKLFKEIEEDKDVNVILFSSKQEGLTKYVGDLKKKRKDIMYISSNVNDEDKEKIKTYNFNFESGSLNRGNEIADMAKSLGAQKLFYFASKKDLEKDGAKEILDEMEKNCKEDNFHIEGFELPSGVGLNEKRAALSSKIDELVRKNGKEVAIYTFDEGMDQVLADKVVDLQFYIPEYGRINASKFLMKEYNIMCITRMSNNFGWLNQQIRSFYNANYGIERRIATIGADPDIFSIQFGVELGKFMNSKREKDSKAYNSYFLEKISKVKCKVDSGFITKYKGVGNLKIIDPDQIVY